MRYNPSLIFLSYNLLNEKPTKSIKLLKKHKLYKKLWCTTCGHAKCPLTLLGHLQGDLSDNSEASFFDLTVGHVEVEAVRHSKLTLSHLILPTAVIQRWAADSLHADVSVVVAALGLREVGKHEVSLHVWGNWYNPGDSGVTLHSRWPTRSSQKDRVVFLCSYWEYISF